jgi:hypothetical protein
MGDLKRRTGYLKAPRFGGLGGKIIWGLKEKTRVTQSPLLRGLGGKINEEFGV